ncbi:hypothetical protein [Gottfriedia acidiceleris]
MKENMSLYIESNVKEKVEAFAKAEKRSKSNAVEYLLELGLKHNEKDK